MAASEPHTPPMRWLLHTGKERSVLHRAREVEPPALELRAQAQAAFATFRERCTYCHGALEVECSELGKGLQPSARSVE